MAHVFFLLWRQCPGIFWIRVWSAVAGVSTCIRTAAGGSAFPSLERIHQFVYHCKKACKGTPILSSLLHFVCCFSSALPTVIRRIIRRVFRSIVANASSEVSSFSSTLWMQATVAGGEEQKRRLPGHHALPIRPGRVQTKRKEHLHCPSCFDISPQCKCSWHFLGDTLQPWFVSPWALNIGVLIGHSGS